MRSEKAIKEIISGRKQGLVPLLLRCALWFFSFPYFLAVRWRNRRFNNPKNVHRASVPVISVGNLTTGGTGKTPLVCYLAKKLRGQDLRVTILSRGYRADEHGVNDEALELEVRLPDVPHLQDPDRIKTAELAVDELDAQILILDDGFQHRRLGRDFDLVVIDATEPFGYGYLLPRGLLREPIGSLKRADWILINRCNQVPADKLSSIRTVIQQTAPNVSIVELETAPTHLIDHRGITTSLHSLKGKKAIAFCGIGNPLGFQSTLNEMGLLSVGPLKEFPDHHRYSRDDIAELRSWVAEQPECDIVLCTHKDLVKIDLGQLGGKPLAAVLISSKIVKAEELFWQNLLQKLSLRDSPVGHPG